MKKINILITTILLIIIGNNILFCQTWIENKLVDYSRNKFIKGIAFNNNGIWLLTSRKIIRYNNDKIETFLLDHNSEGSLIKFKTDPNDNENIKFGNYWDYLINSSDTLCVTGMGGEVPAIFLLIKNDTVHRYSMDYNSKYVYHIKNVFFDDDSCLWIHIIFSKKDNSELFSEKTYESIFYFYNKVFHDYIVEFRSPGFNSNFFIYNGKKYLMMNGEKNNKSVFKLCEIINGKFKDHIILDFNGEKYLDYTYNIKDSVLYILNKKNELIIYNLASKILIKKDYSMYYSNVEHFSIVNNNIYLSNSKNLYSINLETDIFTTITPFNEIHNCELIVDNIISNEKDYLYVLYNWIFVEECGIGLSILNLNNN